MQHFERTRFKLKLHFIPEGTEVAVFERIGKQTDLVVHDAHFAKDRLRHARTKHERAVFLLCETPEKMAGLPFVDKYLGFFCLIPYMLCQPAMVLVGMGQHDPAYVREFHAMMSELSAQCIGRFFSLGPDSDKRE